MKFRRPLAALLLPCLILLSAQSQAFVGGIAVSIGRATNVEGAEIPPFSADAQIETEENQMTSRVYYQPGMVRDESNMGGMQMVTIQRYDQGKVWVLMSPTHVHGNSHRPVGTGAGVQTYRALGRRHGNG